ncbi:MAG: molybdopterin-dependent oxidoreductase, partial [Ktedonobacterales bacterium]
CKPGTEWLRFTRKQQPKDRMWTTLEEELEVPVVMGQPGGSNLGLGRHWHFFAAIFWMLNGLVYLVLLFASGEWSRLVPTTWRIFPNAWQTLVSYLTFHAPPKALYIGVYDPLQQLSYFAVVFLLAPFLILTAAAQSPAVEGQFPWYPKLFGGRQGARSLHFLGLLAFIGFIIIHTAMVFLTGPLHNFGDIIMGQHTSHQGAALAIGLSLIILIVAIYALTSWLSRRDPRATQRLLSAFIRPPMNVLSRHSESKQRQPLEHVSEFFIVNGQPPSGAEFLKLLWSDFADYRLEIGGLVERPLALSIADLRALPKQTQVTRHNCIQGWSSIGEWGGVPLREIVKLAHPTGNARYLVFRSFSLDTSGNEYFETVRLTLADHPQALLAYEMNGHSLPLAHGAPLRLRLENQLGFKMVKWLKSIEFVESFRTVGEGLGGSREENKHYEQSVPI